MTFYCQPLTYDTIYPPSFLSLRLAQHIFTFGTAVPLPSPSALLPVREQALPTSWTSNLYHSTPDPTYVQLGSLLHHRSFAAFDLILTSLHLCKLRHGSLLHSAVPPAPAQVPGSKAQLC